MAKAVLVMDMPENCFNCDDCIWYNGDKGTDNWVGECRKYKVTSVCAERLRSRLKVL